MVATSSIRTRVRNEIISRLNNHPALLGQDGQRVPISPGLVAGDAEREHVFVVRTAGRRQVAFLEAGRKTIEDDFTISFVFMAATPGADTLEADDRVEYMSTALSDVLADDPSLGDLDGLMWATEAEANGPDHQLTDDGAIGFMHVDVECKARYE